MRGLAAIRGRPLAAGEAARKLVHASMGVFALALPFLLWWQAALCALAAFLHNWLVLPRVVGHRMRSAREGASDRGVLLYPVVVGALILVFWRDLSLAALGWGLLAGGDAAAGVAGMKWGRRRLPWNPRKTWAGLVGAFLGALVGGEVLYLAFLTRVFTVPLSSTEVGPVWTWLVAAGAVAALVFALVEGAPLAVDDNLLAPSLGALAFFSLSVGGGGLEAWRGALPETLVVALAVNGGCALLAAWKRVLSPAGIAGAYLLGGVTWVFGGVRLWLVLFLFLAAGTAVTRVGWRKKVALGIAEGHGGQRGLGNVAAKGVVVFAAALLMPFAEAWVLRAMAVAALAAALADTAGSEVGKAFSRRAYNLPRLQPVAAGTPGALSAVGTLASAAAAAGLVGLAAALALVEWRTAVVCGICGFAAALVEGRFSRDVGHDAVNLTLTLVAAALAGGLLVMMGR